MLRFPSTRLSLRVTIAAVVLADVVTPAGSIAARLHELRIRV
jgi:hypothetical protein